MSKFYVGIPTLSKYDLLQEAVDSINRSSLKPNVIFIQDNGRKCPEIKSEIKTYIIESPYNLGVAASWNKLWDLAGDNPIIIMNDDLQVDVDSLKCLIDCPHLMSCGYRYGLFKLTPSMKDLVGYFDERFWPMYWEDVDYAIRIDRAKVTVGVPLIGEIKHGGSKTYMDNQWMHPFVDANRDKMFRKWGMTLEDEQLMRENKQFNTNSEPTIIDPFEEYMQYGRHLPKTKDFGEVILKWMGF